MKNALLSVRCVVTAAVLWVVLPASFCQAENLSLANAVKEGNRDAVAALIRAHADVNAPLSDGSNVLTLAAYHDQPEIVGMLLAAGAKVNTADEYGETPLTLACLNGSAAVAGKLLAAGADANAARWNGETALMIASRTG